MSVESASEHSENNIEDVRGQVSVNEKSDIGSDNPLLIFSAAVPKHFDAENCNKIMAGIVLAALHAKETKAEITHEA